jgi:hypothetical protein
MRLALRANNFSITDAERFIGITVSSFVKEIKPPDLDRYNDVVKMLREQKADAEERQLEEGILRP